MREVGLQKKIIQQNWNMKWEHSNPPSAKVIQIPDQWKEWLKNILPVVKKFTLC